MSQFHDICEPFANWHQFRRGLFVAPAADAGAGERVKRDIAAMILIAFFTRNTPSMGAPELN
jgi:hypothetical protein